LSKDKVKKPKDKVSKRREYGITLGVMLMETLKEVWATTLDTSANGALSLSRAASAGATHFLLGFEVVVGGAALVSAITITVKDGTTVIWKTRLPASAAIGQTKGVWFNAPIPCTKGNALVLESTAGGASVVLTGNLAGLTKML